MGAFDGFRSLFNIRQERRRPPKGPKPKMGARIYLHDVRMAVQPGLSDELWDWLQELGFREITYSPDRRRYRDLPRSIVTQLYDAPREEWRPILKLAIRESSKRPAVNVSTRPVRATSSS
jgi:hypothetical protein